MNYRIKMFLLAGIGAVGIHMATAVMMQSPSVPQWINFQGRLSGPDGIPLADGTKTVQFKLFDTPTGGNPLWTDTEDVALRGGSYSAKLGKDAPFPPGLFSGPLWLETTVDNKTLTPRQELSAVPFAMVAQEALTVPASAINTSSLADGSVTADKLAGGAIKVYYAQLSPADWVFAQFNQQLDVPGAAISVPISRPSTLVIDASALVHRSVNQAAIYTRVFVDGVSIDGDRGYRNGGTSQVNWGTAAHSIVADVEPGTRVVKLTARGDDPLGLGGQAQIHRASIRVMVLPR